MGVQKRKRLDSGLKEYLKEVQQSLTQADEQVPASDISDNALEEVKGSAAQVVGDARMSKQIEALLACASARGISALVDALSSDGFVRVAKSPWGSYALDSLCSAISRTLTDGTLSAEFAHSLLIPIAHACGDNAPSLAKSKPASHALRSLISLLSTTAQQKQPLADALHALTSHTLASFSNGAAYHVAFYPTGSAFLQALVHAHEAVDESEQTKDTILAAVMNSVFGAADSHRMTNSPQLEPMRRRAWMQLCKDTAGSHFVQELLNVSSPKLVDMLYESVFHKRLCRLAMHKQANYPVQSLLRRLNSETLRAALHELRNELGLLAKNNRGGVLSALLTQAKHIEQLHTHISVLLYSQLRHEYDVPIR